MLINWIGQASTQYYRKPSFPNSTEQIDVVFRVKSPVDPRHTVLEGVPIPHGEERGFNAAFAKLLWPFNLF